MSEISQIVNFLKNNYLSNISYKKKLPPNHKKR